MVVKTQRPEGYETGNILAECSALGSVRRLFHAKGLIRQEEKAFFYHRDTEKNTEEMKSDLV